jgi:tetratricopeptide (TPR) repeat protein
MAISDVSACLIVKNAEPSLPRCLESIADLVRELIVVDTGSTDATPPRAEAFGCRVHHFPWVDDFAAARNESIRYATGRWILWLDADEYLDEPNHRKLQVLLASLPDEDAAYLMTGRSLLATGSPLDCLNTRLFRNHPEIRWRYRVHEQITPAVLRLGHPLRSTDIVIQHAGFEDAQVHRGKLERNTRLLELDLRDHPEDAFILFNLGTAYADLGRLDQAIGLLRQSVAQSPPGDATGRVASLALLQCHRRLGQGNEALAVCLEGRRRNPEDVAFWFWHGQLLLDQRNLAGAEQVLSELVRRGPAPATATVDAALRDYIAPHTLGLVYHAQGRPADAEKLWKAVVHEHPIYKPSWEMLAELYFQQQRWTDLDAIIGQIQGRPEWAADGAILRARWHLAKKEFAPARAILEQLIQQTPQAMPPRFYLTHVLLQEGKDWQAAERALRDLLAIDPYRAQAWYNLASLLRRQNRHSEALEACMTGRKHCPADANLAQLQEAMRRDKPRSG